jgi:hypothetical protein
MSLRITLDEPPFSNFSNMSFNCLITSPKTAFFSKLKINNTKIKFKKQLIKKKNLKFAIKINREQIGSTLSNYN